MEQSKLSPSRLFTTTIISVKKDDIEEKYIHGYHTLQSLISGLSEKEVHDVLNSAVSKDKNHEENISLGLICVILTEPHNAAKSYRDLTLVTRDGLSFVLIHLSQLVLERWLKLQDTARTQLLWLLRELIKNAVTGVDTLCWNIMRHAAGGDISVKNIALVDSLLDVYIENRLWLDKYPLLLSSVVYTYLRLIEDHSSPALMCLRQKEVTFTVSLLRERFTECLVIGRDLVRLLQNVARIPEFERLWRDILRNPKALNPTFTGVLQMLQTRTSRRFLQSRLTPDMEHKMVFLTSSVRFGNHKRYQDWFQKQYLATPEAQTLRSDLIRFIVGVIHPTNELLCSDIIPRWAVIGWLLTTTTSNIAVSNAKLALFYDWLFFEPDKDNIMNIEPAILVMHHSMRSHPAVTASLLDFLCRLIPNFYPVLTNKVRLGIYSSLRQILEKRVLPTLYPLFDNPRLDRELKLMVRETFLEFCCPPAIEGSKVDDMKEDIVHHLEGHPNHSLPNNHVDQSEPVFSDDESEPVIRHGGDDEDDDDIPLDFPYRSLNQIFQLNLLHYQFHTYALNSTLPYFDFSNCLLHAAKVRLKGTPPPEELKLDNSDVAQGLEGPIRIAVERLYAETDNEKKCEAMERLVQLVIQEEDLDSDILVTLGSCLCTVLEQALTDSVFPDIVTEESIEDSIGRPLFVLFRNLSELTEEDTRRLPLLSVLSEMYSQQQRIGYLLLYYLQASSPPDYGEGSKMNSNGKSHVYKEFCVTLDKELEPCLLTDLKLCQDDDVELLCWLVPGIYTQFPNVAVGNAALLHLVVSTVDARQLQELVCRVVQGRLVMFRLDSFLALLSASLSWETFEQYCLWQLVTAHGIPVDYVLPILPRLEYKNHAEALTSILLMLKQERPTADLVKHILSRDVKPDGDMFVVSVLRCWCREHEERLGELVANLLSSKCPPLSPNKRKRGLAVKVSGSPTAEKLLSHLDRLRPGSRQFYRLEAMQKALQQAQSSCTDSQRNLFSNLFALLEVDDPVRGKGRGRKPNSNTSNVKNKPNKAVYIKGFSDSSEESSEAEEIIKPKQAKKRKKVNPVCSDSD